MRRRRVIALLSGLTLAWSSAGRAQQPPRIFRIGLLADGPLQEMEGLREGLRDLGYVDGVNVHIEHRWARGRRSQYQVLAAELVKSGVDVIVTWGTPATLGAQAVTTDIPIVTAAVGDPLGSGIVGETGSHVARLAAWKLQALGTVLTPEHHTRWHVIDGCGWGSAAAVNAPRLALK